MLNMRCLEIILGMTAERTKKGASGKHLERVDPLKQFVHGPLALRCGVTLLACASHKMMVLGLVY